MIIKRMALAALAALLLIATMTIAASPASADGGGGTIVCHKGVCWVVVGSPGHHGGGGKGGGGGSGGCSRQGKTVPCTTTSGYFNSADGCYYREANPYPTSGPVYVSYKTGGGGIYWAACPFGNGSGGYVWLPQPPPGLGPTPAMLAQRAFDSLTLTKPSTGRYPSGRCGTVRAIPSCTPTRGTTAITRTSER